MGSLNHLKEVVIIGGGAGGCLSALELAKSGECKVYLFEKNAKLMVESSNVSPGRMGLGFHYADVDTALFTLRVTLEFTKRYAKFHQEHGHSNDNPRRHGRYFITKKSLVSTNNVLKTYESIKAEYTRLVKEDPSYEVYGPPEDLYRILEPHEYEEDVNIDNVAVGIETKEELLDWSRMRLFVIDELAELEKKGYIVVKSEAEVVNIVHLKGGRYQIKTKSPNGDVHYKSTDFVINASWYNISKFNNMLGILDKQRINRVKAIVTLDLPEQLYELHSMFFCMGPFCMFSNKGKGVGMITYAPETNMAATTSRELEDVFSDLYFDKPTREKAEHIIEGVSSYIPKIKDATFVKIDYGIIQTIMDENTHDFGIKIGNLDFIHDPERGGIYKRDYCGVTVPQPGYIINACMKLVYCQHNADTVRDIVLNGC